jgi:hypothetical protein
MLDTGYLSEQIKISVDGPTVAGTTEVDSTPVDMNGFDGVLFLVQLGTAAANNTVKAQEDTVVGMGTVQDLAGSSLASSAVATLKTLVLDVKRSTKEFLRVAVLRGTSTTVDSIVAIRYNARTLPAAQVAANVALKQLGSPAEGTP